MQEVRNDEDAELSSSSNGECSVESNTPELAREYVPTMEADEVDLQSTSKVNKAAESEQKSDSNDVNFDKTKLLSSPFLRKFDELVRI